MGWKSEPEPFTDVLDAALIMSVLPRFALRGTLASPNLSQQGEHGDIANCEVGLQSEREQLGTRSESDASPILI